MSSYASAATPSLGVSIAYSSTHVHLKLHAAGGRGTPESIVILPLKDADAENPAWAFDLKDVYFNDKEFDTLRRRPVPKEAGMVPPYELQYSFREWSELGGEQGFSAPLLVVLIYEQPNAASEGLGGGVVMSQAIQLTDHEKRCKEYEAIEQIIADREGRHRVRRALVCLPEPNVGPRPFAVGSCRYESGILDRTPLYLDGSAPGPADQSLSRLGARIRSAISGETDRSSGETNRSRPEGLLMLGDSVYVDANLGLLDARSLEDRMEYAYRNLFSSVGAQSVLGLVPVLSTLDDHEIINDWEPLAANTGDAGSRLMLEKRDEGIAQHRRHMRSESLGRSLWEARSLAGHPVFLMDTRSERQPRHALADPNDASIFGSEQWDALEDWIKRVSQRPQPAFLASPAMIFPRPWSVAGRRPEAVLHADGWSGYPASQNKILRLLYENNASNVVLLSGDEHISSVSHADLTEGSRTVRIHSIHSSGLYAPYPFANSSAADFPEADCWTADCGAVQLQVEVKVDHWAAGDGYAVIDCKQEDGGWWVFGEFDRVQNLQPFSFRIDQR